MKNPHREGHFWPCSFCTWWFLDAVFFGSKMVQKGPESGHLPMTMGFSGSASRPPYFAGSPPPGESDTKRSFDVWRKRRGVCVSPAGMSARGVLTTSPELCKQPISRLALTTSITSSNPKTDKSVVYSCFTYIILYIICHGEILTSVEGLSLLGLPEYRKYHTPKC